MLYFDSEEKRLEIIGKVIGGWGKIHDYGVTRRVHISPHPPIVFPTMSNLHKETHTHTNHLVGAAEKTKINFVRVY